MKKPFRKNEWVVLLDHEETPYVLINKMAKVVQGSRQGYVGVVAYDEYGDVVMEGSARTDGILRISVACVRHLRPLEQLALAATEEPAKARQKKRADSSIDEFEEGEDG